MDEDVLRKVEKIMPVQLEPGDVVVVRSSWALPESELIRLRQIMADVFPNNHIVILNRDIDIEIYREIKHGL